MFGLYDYMRHALSKIRRSKGSAVDFDRICSRLVDSKKKRGDDDFHDICSSFKTREITLDNMFYECVGMSGDEIISQCRRERQIF